MAQYVQDDISISQTHVVPPPPVAAGQPATGVARPRKALRSRGLRASQRFPMQTFAFWLRSLRPDTTRGRGPWCMTSLAQQTEQRQYAKRSSSSPHGTPACHVR